MKTKITFLETENHLLKDIFQDFINDKQRHNLSPKTIKCYTDTFNYFIQIVKIDTVEELNQCIYDKFIDELFKKNIKSISVKHYNQNIGPFITYLNNLYNLKIKKPRIITDESIPKNYTDEELQVLLKKPHTDNYFVEYRTWVICNFVISTGARSSTIRNIKVEDLDLSTGYVTFRHMKTHKPITIPLPDALQSIIRAYIKMYGITDYLFPNIANQQLTENALKLSWKRYCSSRNIKKHSLHALRHSFTRIMAVNGTNAFIIQKMLGHSTITMSAHYCNLFNEDLKGIETPLDIILARNSKKHVIKKLK